MILNIFHIGKTTYAYYLHHVKTNPALKEWFKQKMLAMKGEGEDPGPRPGLRPARTRSTRPTMKVNSNNGYYCWEHSCYIR